MSQAETLLTSDAVDGGLPRFAAALREVLPHLEIRPGTVIGRFDSAVTDSPKRSSRLTSF